MSRTFTQIEDEAHKLPHFAEGKAGPLATIAVPTWRLKGAINRAHIHGIATAEALESLADSARLEAQRIRSYLDGHRDSPDLIGNYGHSVAGIEMDRDRFSSALAVITALAGEGDE